MYFFCISLVLRREEGLFLALSKKDIFEARFVTLLFLLVVLSAK